MKITLAGRILGLNLGCVIAVALACGLTTVVVVRRSFQQLAQDDLRGLELCRRNVEADVQDSQKAVAAAVARFAAKAEVVEALAQKDAARLQSLVAAAHKEVPELSCLDVTDERGLALTATGSAMAGRDLSHRGTVKKALAGQATSGFEVAAENQFVLSAGHPIRNGSQTVGTVIGACDLVAENRFVDRIKATTGSSARCSRMTSGGARPWSPAENGWSARA